MTYKCNINIKWIKIMQLKIKFEKKNSELTRNKSVIYSKYISFFYELNIFHFITLMLFTGISFHYFILLKIQNFK